MTLDAVIAGLGPGGATAAAALARAGLRVEAYDPVRVYRKACGDASPAGGVVARIAEKAGVVVDDVGLFRVLVNGSEAAVVDFHGRAWVIIDKTGFVQALREEAGSEGAALRYAPAPRRIPRGVLYVDARGPYTGAPGWIMVYRVIARAPGWPPGEAVIGYDLDRVGLYWVFPAGSGRVNVGVGWLNRSRSVEEARAWSLKYAREVAGAVEVVDERAAPLRVAGPVDPAPLPGRVAVGEAAGFVVSVTGEGIRQAVESGLALGEAARRCGGSAACVEREYPRLVGPQAAEAALSRRLLALVASSPRAAAPVVAGLPEGFWRSLIAGDRLGWGMLLKAVARRPALALGLARLLLSSKSSRAARRK
ncbi:geranylgeranyl reductase family protein [Stetteria hydrogenophila]